MLKYALLISALITLASIAVKNYCLDRHYDTNNSWMLVLSVFFHIIVVILTGINIILSVYITTQLGG